MLKERKKERKLGFFFLIAMIIALIGCRIRITLPPPAPPPPVLACIQTEVRNFECSRNSSPVPQVLLGNGMLKVAVEGMTSDPKFSQTTTFKKTSMSVGSITSNNGTLSLPQAHSIFVENLNIGIPTEGSFTISVTYTEFGVNAPSDPANNLSFCPNPWVNTSQNYRCYFWNKKVTFQAGTKLMCDPADIFDLDNGDGQKRIGSCS
jgi:hypothetical protein